ncbi:Alpha/Beta hydrolase protein [Aspergillus leporis]|uniref:feruloyl esterase n=1 Tax=Aspergillus leporis TaxID=41062 RepID=A0A5N5WJT4_9EURO|nr:Alpha/Beta hydrolase protein [Aspergillus leporis]
MVVFGRVATFAGLVAQALAAPAPVRRDVTASVLGNLDLFAQYSAAAYCLENLNSTGTELSCSVGNCALVEAASTLTIDEFEESTSYGQPSGFIAADNTNKLLVVSFRGSADLSNWIANLNFGLEGADSLCSGCEVHSGFLQAWGGVANTITTKLAAARKKYPSYRLAFTGHSYGAALAALAATALRNTGLTVDLYTYGQPRIGNLELAEHITNQNKGGNYRVTHTDDIVPNLPPKLIGYHHSSPEYWITSSDDVTVTKDDVREIVGIDSREGNDGTAGLSTKAHRWYFVYISQCSTLY